MEKLSESTKETDTYSIRPLLFTGHAAQKFPRKISAEYKGDHKEKQKKQRDHPPGSDLCHHRLLSGVVYRLVFHRKVRNRTGIARF